MVVHPCEDGRTRGCADRVGDVAVIESHTIASYRVEMRSVIQSMSVGGDGFGCVVVSASKRSAHAHCVPGHAVTLYDAHAMMKTILGLFGPLPRTGFLSWTMATLTCKDEWSQVEEMQTGNRDSCILQDPAKRRNPVQQADLVRVEERLRQSWFTLPFKRSSLAILAGQCPLAVPTRR